MDGFTRLAAALLLAILSNPAAALENELGWTLDSALRQVDRQSKDFDTLLADAAVVARSPAGDEVRSLTGRMYMNRDGDMRIVVANPAPKEMLVTRSEVQEYDPGQALVERFSLSKHKNRMEPYARLGFAASGGDLKSDFLITMLGEERVRGERTLVLELTPKRDQERQVVGKVTLWISEASWMPVRQVIEHVAGQEQLTIDYEGTARNLNLNPELFRANWPRGTKQVRR